MEKYFSNFKLLICSEELRNYIYHSRILRCNLFPALRRIEHFEKTMVHLHNGILHSREKEGAHTLCDSMDGTGEHYAK